MYQATVYALIAFLYSTLVSFGSMGVSLFFATGDLIEVGMFLSGHGSEGSI
jgi:hypothetical protein